MKTFSLTHLYNKIVKEQKEAVLRKALENLKAATPVDTGEARDGWILQEGSISNPVQHIISLNEGTSKQAPAFFIETALLQTKGVQSNGVMVYKV